MAGKPAKTAAKKAASKSAPKTAAKKAAPKAAAPTPAPATWQATPAPAPAVAAPHSSASSTGAPYPQTPVLETPMAVVVLIANLFVPGLGTLIGGIIAHQKLIGRAVAQFFLAIIIVGWVWGIITGVQALINASWGNKNPGSRSA